MLQGPLRLSILAGVLAFGAAGVALALASAGVPFLVGSLVAGVAAGLVDYAAQRQAVAAPAHAPSRGAPSQEAALRAELDAFRASTAAMRHDIRGVLSPALMVSDRLLNHADPAVQRAGQAVVRSVEKATALLANNKTTLDSSLPSK